MNTANPTADRPTDERRADYAPTTGPARYMLAYISETVNHAFARFAKEKPNGGRALDVGCGAQPFRAQIEQLNCHYTGVDVVQNGANTVDVIGVIDQDLPAELLDAPKFDLILCTEVLEHVADWTRAFENFKRLLAPGGWVVITAPHVWPLHEEPYDFWRPTLFGLQFHAKKAGLAVLEERASGSSREVLFTIMNGFLIKPRQNTLWSRVVRSACVIARRIGVKILRSEMINRAVVLEGKHYLSNFVILTHADDR